MAVLCMYRAHWSADQRPGLVWRGWGQCQGHKSFLVKEHHLHTVIKTAGLKCCHKIRLMGHFPLILETQSPNSPHDLWPFFTFILEGIKSVMFYEAFHEDLLSASSQFHLPANANKGCKGGCPSFANGSSLSLACWIQSRGFTPGDAEDWFCPCFPLATSCL